MQGVLISSIGVIGVFVPGLLLLIGILLLPGFLKALLAHPDLSPFTHLRSDKIAFSALVIVFAHTAVFTLGLFSLSLLDFGANIPTRGLRRVIQKAWSMSLVTSMNALS